MATIEDIRKLLQDFLAPDLGILKQGQEDLRQDVRQMRNEGIATELRLLKAIEAMKNEILLTVKVSSQQEQIATLTRENEKLKGEKAQ